MDINDTNVIEANELAAYLRAGWRNLGPFQDGTYLVGRHQHTLACHALDLHE
jgi:hypothetical protein